MIITATRGYMNRFGEVKAPLIFVTVSTSVSEYLFIVVPQ